MRILPVLVWSSVACLGAVAFGAIATSRGEPISAAWLVVAAACVLATGYRFYSKFIAAKVLALDDARTTPAVRLADGRDFVPDVYQRMVSLRFSSDGGLLATASLARHVHVWVLRLVRRRLAEMRLDWDSPPLTAGRPSVPIGSVRVFSTMQPSPQGNAQ